jgi:exodeoxyribonuclease-5
MAYTAKAAAVLPAKGCNPALNIHQWIYKTKGSAGYTLAEELAYTEGKRPAPKRRAKSDRDPAFDLHVRDEVRKADVLVLDEASMVEDGIFADILAIGKPVFVLADPAQLPPPQGFGSFVRNTTPDVFLSQIHRQAEGDPIIALSMLAREGKRIRAGHYGDSCVITASLYALARTKADQVLCGRNSTRTNLNALIRSCRGYTDPLPMPGERVVCLENRHNYGVANGTLWIVRQLRTAIGRFSRREWIEPAVEPEEGGDCLLVPVLAEEFFSLWDFGYCLTVHKSLGSEWSSVVLVDEKWCWKGDGGEHRWLYTGITRAAKRLALVRLPYERRPA